MDNLVANNIVDITLENFQQVILQESREKMVLVDFWAEWCEPCKDLMPILEKIAGEYPDSMILAKVDCEQQQEVAAQFGIRNLPTVMVVKDGQPVDGFAGAQTETQIREMLAKYLPQPEDEYLEKAMQAISQGDYQGAFPLAKQAFELGEDNLEAKLLYIDCMIETGSINQAKELLATIKMVEQDNRFHALNSKIELAEQASQSPEMQKLKEAVEQNPNDLQLKVDLAVQLQQAHKADEALELLYQVLLEDLNFGDAKKIMLDMINALADGDALKSSYRRKVYSLLY
ncbi:thioredoxin [Alteromonas sp. ASW11-130]|uniref:thioredoxin n=1 Tax=Alteromonas sp. ASW11-130 TaxID=3015775 RepID=UPI002242B438|nr:thioredoxin [Alteromonas sp. ASW11-130]MCW8090851.1 thioredoxin [Alteromonas sp. ASW11-130]